MCRIAHTTVYPCYVPTAPCMGMQRAHRRYGPSEPSGIGPPRDPRSVLQTRPLNTSAFFECIRCGCVFALSVQCHTYVPSGPWYRSTSALVRCISKHGEGRPVRVLNHDCSCDIASILGSPLLRSLALCSVIRNASHVRVSYQRPPK